MKTKYKVIVYRSAITGCFVTKRFAEKHPTITIKETIVKYSK